MRHIPPLLGFLALLLSSLDSRAQSDVTARLQEPTAERHRNELQQQPRAAVFWLEPLTPTASPRLSWPPQGKYQLVQKNKMFSPHILIVPVGAILSFPNADPFFHNVFSLFDGKRFDLGLYEAGTSRDVRFERSGVSYIFCNIHPEMAAVVITLKTPLWSMALPHGAFHIADVPAGAYDAHVWIEGEDDARLTQWTHRLVVGQQGAVDAGVYQGTPRPVAQHLDKFGKTYRLSPSEY